MKFAVLLPLIATLGCQTVVVSAPNTNHPVMVGKSAVTSSQKRDLPKLDPLEMGNKVEVIAVILPFLGASYTREIKAKQTSGFLDALAIDLQRQNKCSLTVSRIEFKQYEYYALFYNELIDLAYVHPEITRCD